MFFEVTMRKNFQRGASLVEYAILIALISAVAVASTRAVGVNILTGAGLLLTPGGRGGETSDETIVDSVKLSNKLHAFVSLFFSKMNLARSKALTEAMQLAVLRAAGPLLPRTKLSPV